MQQILKAVLFCVVFTLVLVELCYFKSFFPYEAERLVHGLLGLLAVTITLILSLRVDRQPLEDVGLKLGGTTIRNFVTGIFVGALLATAMFSVLIYFTRLKLVRYEDSGFLIFFFATLPLLPLAFMEELAFRSYPLFVLNKKYGPAISIFIMSVLFSLYHVLNGWPVLSSLIGPGIWALVFGASALNSRGIAMPTGIHYAVNLVQAILGTSRGFIPLFTLQGAVERAEEERLGYLIQAGLLMAALLVIFVLQNRSAKNTGHAVADHGYNSDRAF